MATGTLPVTRLAERTSPGSTPAAVPWSRPRAPAAGRSGKWACWPEGEKKGLGLGAPSPGDGHARTAARSSNRRPEVAWPTVHVPPWAPRRPWGKGERQSSRAWRWAGPARGVRAPPPAARARTARLSTRPGCTQGRDRTRAARFLLDDLGQNRKANPSARRVGPQRRFPLRIAIGPPGATR